MIRRSRLLLACALCLGALTACAVEPAPSGDEPEPPPAGRAVLEPPEPIPELRAGSEVSGTLPPGGHDEYEVPLRTGDLLEVVADQRAMDLALSVTDSAGERVVRLDSPVGRTRPEHLWLLAERPGRHTLTVESLEPRDEARYRLEIPRRGPAGEEGAARARATADHAEAHELRRAGRFDEAVERYRSAAGGWSDLGDRSEAGRALYWAAICRQRQGRDGEAVPIFREAARAFEAAGEAEDWAGTENRLGRSLRRLGRPGEALAAYERALELRRRLDDRDDIAALLTRIANLHKAVGDLGAAEIRYDEALAAWEALGERRNEAITRANLAGIYGLAGHLELALDHLDRAAAILPRSAGAGDRAFLAEERAMVLRSLGDTAGARRAYREALRLFRREGAAEKEIPALHGLGLLRYHEGRLDAARERFEEALERAEADGDLRWRGTLLQNLGWVALRAGEPERALLDFARALPLVQRADFAAAEVATASGIARVERELGHLTAARAWALRSLDVVESQRRGSDRDDVRAHFLAARQDAFDFAVDTLMEIHRRSGNPAALESAFEVSERARARWLLEDLPASGRGASESSEADDGPEVARLRRRVNRVEAERLAELSRGVGAEELERTERNLRAALEDLRAALRDPVAGTNRATGEPGSGRPLGLEAIRRDLLGPDTLLLSYDLGPDRSYLWAVTRERLEVFELPAAPEIEAAARRVHRLSAESYRRAVGSQVDLAAAALAELVLEPAAERIAGHRRLLVSLEGALHAVPFGALPDPAGDGPLLDRHRVEIVPSASAAAWLARRERPTGGRAADERLLAVLADPVFGPDDERVAGGPGPRAMDHAHDRAGDPSATRAVPLARLAHAGAEVRAVLARVEPERRVAYLGFDARKAVVTDGALVGYRFLHFATHGWFNSEHPELSALVLSRVDASGAPRDGVLWAHEVAALDLSADLVVLSACETALGPRIAGEGMVGLSHAFFRAGAERVVVSLWRVDDRAAVELMSRFYQGLFRDGLDAPEALRRAQLALREIPRWRSPYYWAGFVLQGGGGDPPTHDGAVRVSRE